MSKLEVNIQTVKIDGLSEILKPTIDSLIQQMDEMFISGLARKGFSFENKELLKKFVSENCRCEIRPLPGTRTYYVNDKPFLIHYYMGKSCNEISNSWIVSLGSFEFID